MGRGGREEIIERNGTSIMLTSEQSIKIDCTFFEFPFLLDLLFLPTPPPLQQSSSFDEPDTTARTVVVACLGLVGVLMAGNVALWYLAQRTATVADGASAKSGAAKKKVSKKKLKRETLRRGLPMPE